MTTRSGQMQQHKGKFIYALIDSADNRIFNTQGINKGTVYCIGDSGVAAVVSDLDKSRVRPDRRNIMAHRAVLELMMQQATAVLPMRFGVVARNVTAVRQLLSANIGLIRQKLDRVSGQVEMGLRVSWDVDNIYEYFVSTHSQLRDARDKLMAGGQGKRAEKIELGRLYERLLSEERQRYTNQVVEILRDYCSDISIGEIKQDNEVMSLACLVSHDEQERFESGIFEASKNFSNDYLFNYTGPWAPHSFVDLELQLPKQRSIS